MMEEAGDGVSRSGSGEEGDVVELPRSQGCFGVVGHSERGWWSSGGALGSAGETA